MVIMADVLAEDAPEIRVISSPESRALRRHDGTVFPLPTFSAWPTAALRRHDADARTRTPLLTFVS